MNTNEPNELSEPNDTTDTGKPDQARIARRLRRALKTKATAPIEDPIAELRHIVKQDKALVKSAVALSHMGSDRKSRETGEVIECRLPKDIQEQLKSQVESINAKRDELRSRMVRCLKGVPIYELFLKRVAGCGPVSAAYFVTEIDIHKATKISNLRRYCGMMVDGGGLERRTSQPKVQGGAGTYNQTMRTVLYLMFDAMRRSVNGGRSSKYLDVWKNYKHRIQHSDRVFDRGVDAKGEWTGKIVNGRGKTVSARGFADSTGWKKAADVFLEDLYIVWRAIEGLPVWPSYYTAKLGYPHGGNGFVVNAPKQLTVDEALALVGDVGSHVAAS